LTYKHDLDRVKVNQQAI